MAARLDARSAFFRRAQMSNSYVEFVQKTAIDAVRKLVLYYREHCSDRVGVGRRAERISECKRTC